MPKLEGQRTIGGVAVVLEPADDEESSQSEMKLRLIYEGALLLSNADR